MTEDAWSFLDHRFASPPSQLQVVRLYEDERPWLSVKVPLGLKSMKELREGCLLTSAMGLLTKTGNEWTKKTKKRFKERSERDKITSSEFHKPLPSLDVSFALARVNDWFDWNSSMNAAGSGDFVKSLVLKGGRGRNTEYITDILTKSPNVRSLTILETTGPLVEGITNSYVPGGGPRELTFKKWKEDEETSVVKFCDQLADPTTPMAQRLKKLVLNEKSGDGWPFKVETAKAFARVLHSTTPLHHFEVYMPPKAADFCLTFKDRLFDRSRASDEENSIDRFADIARPVPMRAKCAFLSVAPKTLGQANLKSILEYASLATSYELILDWCTETKLIKVPKSVLMFKDLY
ncbi:hypothetical protein Poli38472_011178 [Pythium oligandrum]|uniref:Uncharacterized protein n=1 Tax=Pythium oligandrum TaxID=41045 RepID=A0A8K1FRG5_PYTOL|nr:hypothetical protein Poli38472_011178 [Pythium oligandrum]|eukprot:TMW67558.1 hypothetical protein Poli38472_011178 [Pythium oligandrum]